MTINYDFVGYDSVKEYLAAKEKEATKRLNKFDKWCEKKGIKVVPGEKVVI